MRHRYDSFGVTASFGVLDKGDEVYGRSRELLLLL